MQWFTNVRRGARNRYQWSLLPVVDVMMSGKRNICIEAASTEVATNTPLGTQKERLPSGAANVCVS